MSGLTEVSTSDWTELLERLGCADAYLLAEYVESASLLELGRPAFLHLADAGGDVVFPLLVRDLPLGPGHDAVTPYGYGGPVAVGEAPPAARFWELYEEWCRATGVVTSYVRFHPLFANQDYAGAQVHLEQLPGTVGWRLDLPDLFAGMDGSHRNACRKAERAGVAVSVEEGPADLATFTPLYEETMLRVDADGFYRFPASYWDSLVAGLGDRLAVFRAEESGEAVAAALCLATPPWLHYHLAATSERGRALGASNLLLFEAARWARDRGYERFHLGGGLGGRDDSLFSFKRRFDRGGLLEAAVGKVVHDVAAYRELTGREDADPAGFFPAYRA